MNRIHHHAILLSTLAACACDASLKPTPVDKTTGSETANQTGDETDAGDSGGCDKPTPVDKTTSGTGSTSAADCSDIEHVPTHK